MHQYTITFSDGTTATVEASSFSAAMGRVKFPPAQPGGTHIMAVVRSPEWVAVPRDLFGHFALDHVSDDAFCHRGITTKEKCGRCSMLLEARAVLDKHKDMNRQVKTKYFPPSSNSLGDRDGAH